MNFSGIETEILRARIVELLRGAFATEIREVFTTAVGKLDYGYDTDPQVWPVAWGQSFPSSATCRRQTMRPLI